MKPPRLVTVITAVVEFPAGTLKLAVEDLIVKSLTTTVRMRKWDKVPLVPVTLTLNVPGVEAMTVSVETPDVPRMIAFGVSNPVRPEPVGTRTVRNTVPVNPFRLVTVIGAVSLPPTSMVSPELMVDTLKSITSTSILPNRSVRVTPPLEPITVTK